MARTVLTSNQITTAGVSYTLAAANSSGHSISNNGLGFVAIANAHTANTRTVTFVHPGEVDGLAVADLTVTIPAASTKLIGGFSNRFNQSGGTYIHADFSDAAADLTLAAYYFA